ncbi:LIC13081 family protein [Leptospira kirschneri]|uniref:Polyketide cyclase/dehydrase and lipid transport n=1 Tax=Leptospira kirschneri str. H1 TaxID=1049966 RepID=A0A0E2B4W1_9LEPT|nr:hypothetical protein [Leptospira kirschneri]EKO16231.1 hypothetical protein LEP1GSC081_3900 [Leptospira kirschneri str. H1]EKO62152.1 hypothetical protein LEP1GSC082_1315 [Leptospira kirschneri str. H2]EKP06251.1 hypothetical protein LEP1GSC018_1655 [Leptospira kirschneri str. 2008720114]UML81630.1 hypothetical protein FH602_08540 [Leptospira kirschneri]
MITTTVTFLVSYSLDDTFRFVADFRNLIYWGDKISNVSPIPSKNGNGFPIYELLYSFGPFKLKANYFAKEWIPNSRMIMEIQSSLIDQRDIYTFQITNRGTKITFTNHSKLKFPYHFIEKIFASGIRGRIYKEMRQLQNCLYRNESGFPKHFQIIRI